METNNDGELRTVCCMKESERDMAQDILKFNVEPTMNSGENDAPFRIRGHRHRFGLREQQCCRTHGPRSAD